MTRNRGIGWTAIALFAVAVLVIALVVFTAAIDQWSLLNTEAGLWVAGALGFVAAVAGFLSFRTPQGKIAAVARLPRDLHPACLVLRSQE